MLECHPFRLVRHDSLVQAGIKVQELRAVERTVKGLKQPGLLEGRIIRPDARLTGLRLLKLYPSKVRIVVDYEREK